MVYFDSDVIFHFLVLQDKSKHSEARKLVFRALEEDKFVISTLVIQEVGFGLARFGLSNEEIVAKLTFLASRELAEVGQAHIRRALQLAKQIGFKHINDCVHTAIAESLGVNLLFTYNKSDFKRIQKWTPLKVTLL